MKRDEGPLKDLLSERYRIDGELGRGGFATVYQVWNLRLERGEALKVLAPGHQADEDFSPRFMQEVHLAAALEHPSIVKVYDFGQGEGIYWFSMQLVVGQTLRELLLEKRVLDEREVARIAIPLLGALEYSHGRGIVHRDIKPENIILDRERRPYLMDFGVAKVTGSSLKTRTGLFLGTPAYVAPEQAQGKPLDGRADVYAMGVTLYKAVAGHYPFEADDPLQAVVLRLTQPPRPLSQAFPGVNRAFATIVMQALEREPSRRWASAGAMREALAAFLEGRFVEDMSTRAIGMEEIRERGGSVPEPPDAASATVRSPRGASQPPVRSADPSAPEGPSRRAIVIRTVAGAGGVLLLASVGFFGLRDRGTTVRPTAPLPASSPAPTGPSPSATIPPTAPPPAIVASPSPEPTPTPMRISRPATATAPEAPPARRPVTSPEQLTKAPPFEGPTPAGCSGIEMTLRFAVDPEGNIVSPRSDSTDAPPECTRYVRDALSRWKWGPALDATGEPVLSPRLSVLVQLP